MNKFDNISKLIIGAGFSFLGMLLGIAFSFGIKDVAGITIMSYLIGIAIGPHIVYEFASPGLKIYLVSGEIGLAFIKLSVLIFAADKKLSVTEIAKLKKYMIKEFGEQIGEAAEKYIKNNIQSNQSIYNICLPLSKMSYSERIGIITQLFAMAVSDGEFCEEEEMAMQKIAHYLHIGKKRYLIIKSNILGKNNIFGAFGNYQNSGNQQANQNKSYQFFEQFFTPAYNPFVILGIENSAANDEIKKAYRDLAKKYHPDVLTNKSELIKKQSKDKFLEINEAYEKIKKLRGIK